MTKRVALLAVALLMLLALFPATAQAQGERPVYLSLGTSLAAGTIADSTGDNIPFTGRSYTDQLYRTIRWVVPGLRHTKLGCPGETAFTFEFGGICNTGGPLPIYDSPQLQEALDALAKGNVTLVTVDLGANDILQATPALLACGTDFVCIDGILETIAEDVQNVVGKVKAADPHVPIVAMNYYNPNLAAYIGYFSGFPQGPPDPAFAFLSDQLSQAFNGKLAIKYAELGIPVADVASAYRSSDFGDSNGNGVPNNVEVICRLTYMCPDPPAVANIHPTYRGYKLIKWTFLLAIIRNVHSGPMAKLTRADLSA